MSGRKKFTVLEQALEERLKTDPESRRDVAFEHQAMRDALALSDLRAQRGLTQNDVAGVLRVSQANISQVERKTDLYLSTLSRYVEALGGQLELSAVFPDQRIMVSIPKAG